MVEHTMDVSGWLRKQLEEASPDLLRAMVKDFAEALMSADADAVCGAGYGERSPERVNRRNGYRERDWDTRVGSIELAVPKLREGAYFPDWLLQPRRRAEQAFVSVIADAYLAGVSTRRVEKLVQQLGVERMSKSQVSRLAKSLDQIVEDFRTRPLDGAPYAYVTLDALQVKCREGGRTVNVCVVHAVGVNRDGFRESLGLDVVTSEDGAAWLAFLRGLVARGLAGVKLVSSDAHPGLVDAIAATLPGASLAALPHALHAQPAHARPEERAELRRDDGADDLRPARRGDRARAARAASSTSSRRASPKRRRCSTRRPRTCSPSPPSRRSTGGSSGATTRSSGSTRRSAAAPTSSASSPTAPRSSASSAPSSPSRTTSGPSPRRYMSAESITKALADPVDEPEEVMAIAAAA